MGFRPVGVRPVGTPTSWDSDQLGFRPVGTPTSWGSDQLGFRPHRPDQLRLRSQNSEGVRPGSPRPGSPTASGENRIARKHRSRGCRRVEELTTNAKNHLARLEEHGRALATGSRARRSSAATGARGPTTLQRKTGKQHLDELRHQLTKLHKRKSREEELRGELATGTRAKAEACRSWERRGCVGRS